MNARIKKLRKTLDLTQQEFAERIGSTQNVLANYEGGRRNPSSSVINNICKTFNVNEDWLRTGQGEMFAQQDNFDLTAYAKQHGATELDIQIIKLYLELPENIRAAVVEHFRSGLQPNGASAVQTPTLERDTVESAEAFYEEKMGIVPGSGSARSIGLLASNTTGDTENISKGKMA